MEVRIIFKIYEDCVKKNNSDNNCGEQACEYISKWFSSDISTHIFLRQKGEELQLVKYEINISDQQKQFVKKAVGNNEECLKKPKEYIRRMKNRTIWKTQPGK